MSGGGQLECTVTAWAAWPCAAERLALSQPPSVLRRRVSPLGQQALRLAWDMASARDARFILSSRHGEFGRTLSILTSIVTRDAVSPADFSLSVHHALAGLLATATENRRGHTAIAAGCESFCFALMEAAASLAERPDEPVILIHYDEPLPGPYRDFDRPDAAPEVVVLALSAAGSGPRIVTAATPRDGMPAQGEAAAGCFLPLLAESVDDASFVGEQMAWRWRRHASAV